VSLELDFRAVNFFVLPSTGFELTPLIHCNTIRLVLRPFIILYNILKIVELECCQIIILSIYVPSTRAYTHVLRLSLIYLSYWISKLLVILG
jgi:hypothetical protein